MIAQARGASFAARTQATWWWTPVGSDEPSVITVNALVHLIETAERSAPIGSRDAGRRSVVPPAHDVVVEPRWALVGEVTSGGWLVEASGAEPLLLDAEDLRVLDALVGPITVHDLTRASAVTDAPVRLGRLVAAGVVAVSVPAVDEASRPPEPVTVPQAVPERDVVDPGGDPGRVPVYAIWHPEIGPLLSLGMLTAAARHHDGGALNQTYEIRRPERADSFLADLERRTGPAVLLCSDYVWSLHANLRAAEQGRARNPELVVIHGGPSSPKYEGDARRFLDEHRAVAHVLTRGEGELLIGPLLAALAPTLPAMDPDRLRQLEGVSFLDPVTDDMVRTGEPARITDLDALPSPYLTGEFDHLPGSAWTTCLSVETNRGCPYGCTFCDWGSATLSRIRMFSPDRVEAEVRWAAARGVQAINLPDANFGIMSRDVDTATRIAAVKQVTGSPKYLVFYPAKNTTKHLARIMDILADAGISSAASLSLQTIDPDTLQALDRTNISTAHFVALAAEYRRRHHPLQGDLLLGVPGQTYDTYKTDLQFMFDHEILARTWPVQILPNAPMNAPEYRALHQIEVEDDLVVATATLTRADRERMLRLRKLDLIADRYGVLRHVLRWVQWDHDVPALDVVDHLVGLIDTAPDRHPHLTWVLSYFDLLPTAPVSWRAVYDDVARLLRDDFGVGPSSALDAVLDVQVALMPAPGRVFPATVPLAHDYVRYYQDATASLFGDGHAGRPPRPLADYTAAELTVTGDPLGLCQQGMFLAGDNRGERSQGQFQIGATVAHELESPLLRLLPHVEASGVPAADRPMPEVPAPVDDRWQEADLDDRRLIQVSPAAVPVRIDS